MIDPIPSSSPFSPEPTRAPKANERIAVAGLISQLTSILKKCQLPHL